MKVIHVQLRKGRNLIRLRGTSLNTSNDKTLRVSRCSVIWTQKNIRSSINNSIVVDSVSKTIPEGYYTFSELKEYLKSEYRITIEKLRSNHIELTSEKDLNLKSFGPLLGFEKDKAITKTTKYTSTFPAEMTNGLREINVFCPSLVDGYRNYSISRGEYIPSSLLLDINTTQKLSGTITNFDLDNTRGPLSDFSGQDIEFEVISGGHIYDYEIRLTIVIE